jgi:hypothetical protein
VPDQCGTVRAPFAFGKAGLQSPRNCIFFRGSSPPSHPLQRGCSALQGSKVPRTTTYLYKQES